MKKIIGEFEWEFSEANYFLGLGGVPNDKWLSISPRIVSLKPYDKIKTFEPSFELASVTDYYISPPGMKNGDSVNFGYPLFI